jgi:hypothetical protein
MSVNFIDIWYIKGHLVNFMSIWYILWSFGKFCGHLVHIFGFGMLHQEKSGNPVSALTG